MTANIREIHKLPGWVPEAVRLYLWHTEAGVPLRALARAQGCHPSTVLRRVRRYESRRDDPLVDEALDILGRRRAACGPASPRAAQASMGSSGQPDKDDSDMTAQLQTDTAQLCDGATITREARRILRRLSEADTILAVAPEMEKAVVLKETAGGANTRLAVVGRDVARAFALKDWIACRRAGRVSAYTITPMGRAALKRLMAEEGGAHGCAEAAMPFADQHRDYQPRSYATHGDAVERLRCNMAESPVAMLARRRDRQGHAFLSAEHVAAAERLREDFELSQLGPRVTQNWDRFLTGGARSDFAASDGPAKGPQDARARMAAALHDLGPGLGDVALRCCCYLDGLEATEQRMGWSARSGKIVLRIALTRLARHYQETAGARLPLIG